jgi:hypothetical protein
VGLNDLAARLVIYRSLQILHERPVAPHIQGLGPVTDGEDGFMKIESILEQ